MPSSIVFLEDCNITMSRYPNKYFDIAIVDIPYGIGAGTMPFTQKHGNYIKQKNGSKIYYRKPKSIPKEWDITPPHQEYFDELRRVSKEQIIFGADYTDWKGLGKGRIKWNKGFPEDVSFNQFEYAYCSLINYEIEIPLLWAGMMQAKSLSEPMIQQGNKKLNEKRGHPCHKPVLLYKKLLLEFAAPGMKIYDSHLGAGSNRIACYDYDCDFTGSEIDQDYYNYQEKRFKNYILQPKLKFAS